MGYTVPMGLDGTYRATVEVGGTPRTGTLQIASDDDTVWLTVDAPILGRVEAVGTVEADDSFAASGTVRVLLKRVSYELVGRVRGDTLLAVCETSMGTAEVVGTRIA